jgi:hypothetical protein
MQSIAKNAANIFHVEAVASMVLVVTIIHKGKQSLVLH